jgi:hypothetical protein
MTNSEIQLVETKPLEARGAAELKLLCDDTQAKRKVVLEYIKDNFEEGTDYGPSDSRSDKKTLLKPGAEKVCRLFDTRPVWRKDSDTWEMLGSPAGTVCYICEIIHNPTGRVVGEGRGAEKVGNKSRDANKAIKAAEKCALVDAALYTFCLSELFTQDIEEQAGRLEAQDGDEQDTPATQKDKHTLYLVVDAHRKSRKCSDMSTKATNGLIKSVILTEFQKGTIDTMKELVRVREAITGGQYDLDTGEKIPANIGEGELPGAESESI